MSTGSEAGKHEGGLEKGSRFLRNFNLAVAIGSTAVGAAINSELLVAYGVFNFAQAGFFEITRRWAQRKNSVKKMGNLALKPT